MLQAITMDGERITPARMPKEMLRQLKKENDQFYCPSCKEKVILRAGNKVIAHFAHMANTNCIASGGEGPYHEKGKLLLYEWFLRQNLSVELEKYLPELKQRPDFYIHLNNRKIVIEYQCARISLPEIINRTNGYKKHGIDVIWILGAKLFKRLGNQIFKLDSFSQSMLHQFSPEYPLSIFYFCPETNKLIKLQNLSFLNNTHVLGKLTIHSLNNINFIELFTPHFLTERELIYGWEREKKRFRFRRRGRLYGEELQWHQWLYLKKLYIEQLPPIIHLPVPSSYLIKVPTWNWQSRLIYDILQPLHIYGNLSLTSCRHLLRKYLLPIENFPLINNEQDPILEYLRLLTKLGYLEEISLTHFRKQKDLDDDSQSKLPQQSDAAILKEIFQKNEPKSEHSRVIFRYTK
ncbi:competence protein CoiA [Oceanobacillus sp. CAU 1775]